MRLPVLARQSRASRARIAQLKATPHVSVEPLEPRLCLSGLALTQVGSAAGFKLTTFASNFPPTNQSIGPAGIIVFSNGHVMVSDLAGHVRVFSMDKDGQDAASAPAVTHAISHTQGLALLGNSIYMADPD